MSNRDTAATLEYHEATKHSERSVRASRHFLDFENQPLAFKIYRDLETIPLPRSSPGNDLPALEAISLPGAAPAAEAAQERTPDLATLSRTPGAVPGSRRTSRPSIVLASMAPPRSR